MTLPPVNARTGDADRTRGGRHCRLIVFGSLDGHSVTIREDIDPDLPRASEADRKRAALGWQRQHPRGTRLEPIGPGGEYRSGAGSWSSVDWDYRVVRPGVTP